MLPVCRLDKERENAAALEVLPDLLKVGKGLLQCGPRFEYVVASVTGSWRHKQVHLLPSSNEDSSV